MSKEIKYQKLPTNKIQDLQIQDDEGGGGGRKIKWKELTFAFILSAFISSTIVYFHTISGTPPAPTTISSLSASTSFAEIIQDNDKKQTNNLKPKFSPKTAPNIIFHKTHKTGSTSIQNIMFRLGLKHKLPILWGKFPGTTIGYPSDFTTDMVINKEKTARISTNHMRTTSQLMKFFDQKKWDTFQFTILRHPYSAMKSAYLYYGPEITCFYNSKNFSDFINRYDELSRKNHDGIAKSERIYNKKAFCQNFLSYDLGYAKDLYWIEDKPAYQASQYESAKLKFKNKQTKAYLNSTITKLDEQMNLVLILEHYWESIILLKEALNLEYEDVTAFKMNRAIPADPSTLGFDSSNPKIVEQYKQKIEQYLPIDTAIYNHFYQVFLQKWYNYGQLKMKQEVAKLKKLTENEEKSCKVTEVVPQGKDFFTPSQHIPQNKIPWHPVGVKITTLLIDVDQNENPELYERCLQMTLPELKMGARTKKMQREDGYLVVKEQFEPKKQVQNKKNVNVSVGKKEGLTSLEQIDNQHISTYLKSRAKGSLGHA